MNARARALHAEPCPRCGGPGPLDVHTSHRVWSLLVVTTSSSHAELSCRGCAVKSLFGDTVFSAALGWWSPRGIVRTPIVIARNLFAMARRTDPANPTPLLLTVARTNIAKDRIAAQGEDADPGVYRYPGSRKQECPICSAEVAERPRYPRYVCRTCATRAQSADGRPLAFWNAGLAGGFVAQYRDTDEEYSSHECFVDGVRCHADEAKFGGIVIEALDPAV